MPSREHDGEAPECVRPFSVEVGRMLGVAPERVARIVAISNAGGHVFHGVKRVSTLPEVRATGVHPLTPEGGMASYWTSGIALFGDPSGGNPVDKFFNVTFFNYAHAHDDGAHGRSTMALAITNRDVLRAVDPSCTFRPDAELAIHKVVPPHRCHLLVVDGEDSEGVAPLQTRCFEALERLLVDGYSLGKETVVGVDGSLKESPLGRSAA